MRDKRRRQILFLLFFILAACARGIYHQVKPGETLSGIGLVYGIPYKKLARLNHIHNPDKLEVGQKIFIPKALRRLAVSTTAAAKPQRKARFKSSWNSKVPDKALGKAPFTWPLKGEVTSRFGPRNGSFHDGIDIGAPVGTPVRAAADGRVIYSGVLRGYGNVVIVRHGRGYVTVYAHHKVNRVKEGEDIRRGQKIAEVGTSGRTTGPSLHFEVRKNNLARNPLPYLPRNGRLVRSRKP